MVLRAGHRTRYVSPLISTPGLRTLHPAAAAGAGDVGEGARGAALALAQAAGGGTVARRRRRRRSGSRPHPLLRHVRLPRGRLRHRPVAIAGTVPKQPRVRPFPARRSPVLSARAIAAANAGDGLNLAILHFGIARTVSAEEERTIALTAQTGFRRCSMGNRGSRGLQEPYGAADLP